MVFFLFGVNLITTPTASYADTHEFQVWAPVYLDVPVTNKVHLYSEVQPRLNKNLTDIDQILMSVGAEYRFNKNVSVMLGHTWVPTYKPGPNVVHEQRIWQQLLIKTPIKKATWQNRLRTEQRFIEHNNGTPALRARWMTRLSHPIGDDQPNGDPTRYYVAVSNEAMVNINSVQAGPKTGFDQNRLWLAVGRHFGKHHKHRIEVGYQWQWVNRQAPSPDHSGHTLGIQTFFSL